MLSKIYPNIIFQASTRSPHTDENLAFIGSQLTQAQSL
jgi:hypothetical protein